MKCGVDEYVSKLKEELGKYGNSKVAVALLAELDTMQEDAPKKVDTLESEVADTYAMFELLGLSPRTVRGSIEPTVEEVLTAQEAVLGAIGKKTIMKDLQSILDNNAWIGVGTDKHTDYYRKDRQKRATSKEGKRSGADKFKKGTSKYKLKEQEYIVYQIAEELNEVLEQLLVEDGSAVDALKRQKELFKVTRFGADTKIKDGKNEDGSQKYKLDKNGNPLTNITRVQESLGKDSVNIAEELQKVGEEIGKLGQEETSTPETTASGFKGYKGGFDTSGKGTSQGDGSTGLQHRLGVLLDAYNSGKGTVVGGGFVENVTSESVTDEDIAAGTFEKGIKTDSVADLLPPMDGRTLNKYTRNYNKYYNERNRSKGVSDSMRELMSLLDKIEDEPSLEGILDFKKEQTKQEQDIIKPSKTFEKNVNNTIKCQGN